MPIPILIHCRGLPCDRRRVARTKAPMGPAPPPDDNEEGEKTTNGADYGGLEIAMLEEGGGARNILRDWRDNSGHVFNPEEDETDDVDQYYAFDDDYIRNTYQAYDDDEFKGYKEKRSCRRVSWHRLNHPTCNMFHEVDFVDVEKYISHGYYRDVFHIKKSFNNISENLVWKTLRYELDFEADSYEYVRMDALVSERLSSNPRFVDMFGHCGTSVATEYLSFGDLEGMVVPNGGYIKQKFLMDIDDVHPQNQLDPTDKLAIALEMAEAIADMHGFEDGIIVHDDIQLSQFLLTDDGHIKLNDFNRAEVMLWDEDNNEYCKYRNGKGHGNYRAPEEYMNKPLDEKIDVFSMGNNIYALLTGLWMFYDMDDDEGAVQKRIDGEMPYIDERYRTRSFPEAKLVEIMERCWVYDPKERADIFEVVDFLKHAIQENQQRKRQLLGHTQAQDKNE